MRKKNMFAVLAALLCAVVVSANEPIVKKPEVGITEQLQEMLADNYISVSHGDVTAQVVFKVNEQGRIQVLDVTSKRKDVKLFIDRRLDGRIIAAGSNALGKVFTVDVRITS